MLFKQTSLSLTIAGLLLGALLIGCGDSGDTPKSMKKPDNVSKTNAAPLKNEKATSAQPLETVKEGRNFLNRQKLAGEEAKPLAAAPERVHRRRSSTTKEREPAPPYIAPHVEMPQ